VVFWGSSQFHGVDSFLLISAPGRNVRLHSRNGRIDVGPVRLLKVGLE
jgi:hypothetical protein